MRRSLLTKCVLSVVALGAFAILAIGSSDSSGRPPAPIHDKISAYTMCQQFTEKQLKAPSTAKWPWGASSDATTDLGGGRYRVRTHVDAQNSFGAMIRSQVDCTVKFVGGDRWQLEELQVN